MGRRQAREEMDIKLSDFIFSIKHNVHISEEEKALIRIMSAMYQPWVDSLSSKERYLLRKYTYNSNDAGRPNRFFERLNRTMRGDYFGTDQPRLKEYGDIISKAILKTSPEIPIVCYRGVDDDLMKDVETGTVFTFNQFISTSIVEAGALKKRFKYVIVAPVGTKGAYIENLSAFSGQYEFLLDISCEYILSEKKGKTVFLEVVV